MPHFAGFDQMCHARKALVLSPLENLKPIQRIVKYIWPQEF